MPISEMSRRNIKILIMAMDGVPYKDIADKFGISIQRVSYIANAGGYRRAGKKRDNINLAEQVFEYILRYKAGNDGNSPTLREISDELGLNSTCTARRMLTILEESGRIVVTGNQAARSIVVIGGYWTYENAGV